ncbi:MAG TPA: LacI family DNA-binding transcriptional regulator [Pseudonocardiaceae bacterium]|nr:LacI family DNA-binding transcriptional regulator [Pseudonocardiaceae bacterium]
MKRPTIADIARRAGVTKAAVSFALNGQPGVSESTRGRIMQIAEELGWQPNSAARALSDGRSGVFGLVIDRPASTLGVEPFFMQLISGMQAELSREHIALLFTMAQGPTAEAELYREWWAQRRVDGVFLVDLQINDSRVPLLEDLGLPTVVVGSPRGSGSLPAVWTDDGRSAEMVVEYLVGLGHRRLARVTGMAHYWHTKIRTDAFAAVARRHGVSATFVEADYTSEHGAEATRELLRAPEPPTAILYDNDVMALAGLTVVQRAGLRVPADVSIVAWEDSALCELVHPSLTALHRDIPAHGAQAARQLIALTRHVRLIDLRDPSPVLVRRASTTAVDT